MFRFEFGHQVILKSKSEWKHFLEFLKLYRSNFVKMWYWKKYFLKLYARERYSSNEGRDFFEENSNLKIGLFLMYGLLSEHCKCVKSPKNLH